MTKNSNPPISWEFSEHNTYTYSKKWYLIAFIVLLLFLLYAFLTTNFLFALIIIMFGIIIMLNHYRQPQRIKFVIDERGIQLGSKQYNYKDLNSFWLIYEPEQKIKALYFSFNSPWRPRLLIPLEKQNPLEVRAFLRQYLKEDLDQTEEPFSDFLARFFKIF